jgi:ParB family chromosome partitioning protein
VRAAPPSSPLVGRVLLRLDGCADERSARPTTAAQPYRGGLLDGVTPCRELVAIASDRRTRDHVAINDCPGEHMDMKTSAANLSQEIRVPFNKLRLSPTNVRKPAPKGDKQRFKLSIESLAHSILIVGLLQNLVVTQTEGEAFDVEAGGRRYTALALLVKQGKIPETYEVRCLLVPKDAALIASLTENIEREQLHPVDELESWQKLVDGGTGIEDVAAIFHVTPDVVRRRLKLASVSPRLLKACREGEASIEQLMALSVTDDHKAQERAFFNVQMDWQRDPKELRARLTEGDVCFANDGAARLVGIEAYRAAGGVVRQDLFAEEDGKGVYLCDKDLLDRLAVEKLAGQIETYKAAGWSWVEGMVRGVHSSTFYQWYRVKPSRRKPTEDEAKEIAKLDKKVKAAEKKAENYTGDDDDHNDALHEQLDAAQAALAAVRDGLMNFQKKHLEVAGVVLWIERDGTVRVEQGLVKDEDVKRAKALEKPAKKKGAAAEAEETEEPKSALSESLTRRLTAQRTLALQAELAQQPKVALVAVVHKLAIKAICDYPYHNDLPTRVNCEPQGVFENLDPELPNSAAAAAITKAKQDWQAKLPRNGDDEVDFDKLWTFLMEQDVKHLLALLAVCTALSVNAVQAREGKEHDHAAPLALAVDLDMAQWFRPTAANYFGSVSKATILDGVREFAPEKVADLEKMKKGELATAAEGLAADTRWLPPILRRPAI